MVVTSEADERTDTRRLAHTALAKRGKNAFGMCILNTV